MKPVSSLELSCQVSDISAPLYRAMWVRLVGADSWLPRVSVTVYDGDRTIDAKDVLFGCRSFTLAHGARKPPVYTFKPVRAKWLRIAGYWYPRGGIPIDVYYQTGAPPEGLWLPDPGVEPYRGRG